MTSNSDKPQYKRYRAAPRVPGRRESDTLVGDLTPSGPRRPRRPGEPPGAGAGGRD